MKTRITSLLVPVLLLVMTMTAACTLAPPPQSPTTTPLQPVMRLADDQAFVANEQGRYIAVSRKGVWLKDLSTASVRQLSQAAPLDMAWSPEGDRLALVFAEQPGQTRLVTYIVEGTTDAATTESEQLLPVDFLRLHWSQRGDLLLAGYALQHYRFGSNLSQTLFVFDNSGTRHTLLLGDTTLKPGTAKSYAGHLRSLLQVEFTETGDELVYARLHDPPEFPPYLQLMFRHWQADSGRVLAQLEPGIYRYCFTREPGTLWISPRGHAPVRAALWPEDDLSKALAAPCSEGTVSPTGHYRFVDGQLYDNRQQDNRQRLASWTAGSRLQFLSAGAFLLADSGRLYHGVGLTPETRPVDQEHAWTLRRWLHQGLITPADYRRLVKDPGP